MKQIKNIIIIVLFVLVPFIAKSTHIVGGSLTYEHLGGATYRLTLKMYRDCGPSSIQLPNNVTLEIRGLNGAAFSPSKNVSIPKTQVSVLDPPIDTCAFDPGICVEEAIYTVVVNNLPPNPGGYHIYYRTNARNFSIVNLINPGATGEAFYTYIPDNSLLLTNSSPQWKNFTPVFVCQGNMLNFDHGATDKDGDSLVYSFYTPFTDNPAPTFPGNVATFPLVNFAGGYTFNDPLGGASLTVNPNTGVITGIPPALGQYVLGIKVDEYRNGNYINTVYRDFQFNVINCPPIPTPGIGPMDGCAGLAVNFTNTSTPLTGNSFYWDFGDPLSTTDNSTQVHPSYTYPSIGTYVVMLVAQAGTPCADTIYDTLVVSGITPDFTLPDSICVNSPANFNDISVPTSNATINSWNWDFGDGGVAVIPSPTHTYNSSGVFPVKLVVGTDGGCIDSITKNIYVQSLPQAIARDTFTCASNPVINLNGNVIGATGGLWIGSGGFSPSANNLNAAYTPTATEISNGFSTLILSTTGNGFCPAHSDTMTLSFVSGITADAGNDITVCKDSSNVQLNGIITTAVGGQWTTSGSGSFVPNSFDMNPVYVPSSADTLAGSVQIYLNSVGNGDCTPDADTITITFINTPYVSIMSNDTACAGSVLVPISANSTTGSGYWQTLGTGYFTPNDSLANTNYFADSLDNFNGNVTLVFTSTNNGGCLSYSDTLNIYLIPAPTADFNFISACPNDSVFFTDNSTFVDPIVSWDWDFDNGFMDTLQNTGTVYDTAGTYNVLLTVESANGCVDTVLQSVLVYSLPEADFGVDGICIGVETMFLDSSTVNGSNITNWYWDFGDGLGTDTMQNPIYTYNSNGSYNINLIVQSAQGCWDTIMKPLLIQGLPTANYTSSPASVLINQPFNFTDFSATNITNWYWDFGDSLGTSTDQHPTYSYTESGNYTVCLRVTDVYGCEDSICDVVVVFMPPQVPNGFSPNGDGENDIFYVLGGPYKELEFRIYNNWGEIIFESDDQSIGWPGTKDGVDQPVGVYVYTVRAVTLDDEQHTIKGDVTLLR